MLKAKSAYTQYVRKEKDSSSLKAKRLGRQREYSNHMLNY